MGTCIEQGYAQRRYTSIYTFSMNLGLGEWNKKTALLQANPLLSGHAFFRIEFNPHKLGSKGLSELQLRIDTIFAFWI